MMSFLNEVERINSYSLCITIPGSANAGTFFETFLHISFDCLYKTGHGRCGPGRHAHQMSLTDVEGGF